MHLPLPEYHQPSHNPENRQLMQVTLEDVEYIIVKQSDILAIVE